MQNFQNLRNDENSQHFNIAHTYSVLLWNVYCYLMTTLMKPAGRHCTLCPTTSESPHLGLSTRELSSLQQPALAPLSLGCCTGTAQNVHHNTHSLTAF